MNEDNMMMNFINNIFQDGFSSEDDQYGVVFFKDNVGKGSKKFILHDKLGLEIIEYTKTLDANEVILIHSQPNRNMDNYPNSQDIDLFTKIENELTNYNIGIYNNVLISKQTNEWKCVTFKSVGYPANLK